MVGERIEEIKKIGKASSSSSEEIGAIQGVADKEQFESLMLQQEQQRQRQQQESTTVQATEPAAAGKKPSLMDQVADLSKKVDQVKKVQPADIVAQAQDISSRMDDIKKQLSLPDQAIKPKYRELLTNRLTHINENLRVALSAVGIENIPSATKPVSNNPIDRFLGFLTDGQSQLQTLAKEVDDMHSNKSHLNPGAMLAVQIKVGFIQQELEFFSSTLNQALQSIKTVMNVQI